LLQGTSLGSHRFVLGRQCPFFLPFWSRNIERTQVPEIGAKDVSESLRSVTRDFELTCERIEKEFVLRYLLISVETSNSLEVRDVVEGCK